MPIAPSAEIVIPKQTADKYWLRRLSIDAPKPTEPVNVIVELVPYNSTTGEVVNAAKVLFDVTDVMSKAATQPELTEVMDALLTEVDRQAKLQGLI